MEFVALGGRVLLAVVFATAAFGKFLDRAGARQALEDFRVPEALRAPLSVLLPMCELATAAALLINPSGRVGAAVALVLLLAFVAGIGAAMARGEAPDCHCFGQISSSPAGWGTLLRNAALAVPAVFVVAYGPGRNLWSWLASGSTSTLVSALLAAALAIAAGSALRLWLGKRGLQGELDQAVETLRLFPAGLPTGVKAPAFELESAAGGMQSLEELVARGRRVALVFASPTCDPCRWLMPDVARWQRALSERLTIAVVAAGPPEAIREMAEEFGLQDVLIQHEAEVFERYRAAASPSVQIISIDGRIESRIRSSQGVVEGVIRHALATAPEPVRRVADPDVAAGGALEVSVWSGRGAVA